MRDEKQQIDGGVGETALRRIRDDIVTGILLPGKKLKLDALKNQYGASVSTLREILSRLASENLVTAEGQRGFEVAAATADNLREVADLRLLLDGSSTLLDLHASVFDRFIRYHMLAASFRGSAVMDDHKALFDLAMQRDVDGIVSKLTAHIKSGVDHVLQSGRI